MRRGPESRPATQPSAPVLQRELALLDPVAVGKTETMVFVVPFEFTGYPTAAVAIVLEVDHDSSAEQAATVAACEHDLAESAAKARVAPTTGPVAWTVPALSAAMNALTRPEARRSALIYMAGQTNANLLADTALVANEVTLAELATKVLAATTRPAVTTGPVDSLGELGWMLDHAAFGLLSDMATGGKLKNDPALAAVLVTHTGEAGRHPSSLKEIGNGVSSRADLQGRLIAENMIYLEDSSPGSRIRAYDFLKLRNREPAGYDPLGTPKERRDALERATQAAATTAPAGGQP